MTATIAGPSVKRFVMASLAVLAFVYLLGILILLVAQSSQVRFNVGIASGFATLGVVGMIAAELYLHKRALIIDQDGIHYRAPMSSRTYKWSEIAHIHRSNARTVFGGLDEPCLSYRLLLASGAFRDVAIYYDPGERTQEAITKIDAAIVTYHRKEFSEPIDRLHPYQWALIVAMIVAVAFGLYYLWVYEREEFTAIRAIIS